MPLHRTIAIIGVLALTGCGGGGGRKTHPLKHTVVVQHAGFDSTSGPKTKLAITPLAVRKGTQAELEAGGFTLDAKEKKNTPYYVDVRYENQGPSTVESNSLSVSMEDGDGNLINSTTIIDLGGKPFEKCAAAKRGKLAKGAT